MDMRGEKLLRLLLYVCRNIHESLMIFAACFLVISSILLQFINTDTLADTGNTSALQTDQVTSILPDDLFCFMSSIQS